MYLSHVFLQHLLQMKVVVIPITAAILQILFPFPYYYCSFYPHLRRNTTVIVPITAVLTLSPSQQLKL